MGPIDYVWHEGVLGALGLPFWVVVLAAFVFVFGRSWVYYHGGRLVARGATRTRFADVMTSPRLTRATSMLDRYGIAAVALSFLVPGTGTAVTVGAGFLEMSRIRFLIGIIPGSAAWAITRITVGLAVVDVLYYLATWNPALLGALVLAVTAVVVAYAVLRRRRPAP